MLGLKITATLTGTPHAAQSYKHAAYCMYLERGLKKHCKFLRTQLVKDFGTQIVKSVPESSLRSCVTHILINYLFGSKAVGYLIVGNTNISTLA